MSITFRKAVRTNTSVLIALAGPSGSGKTFSALRLARGLVGAEGAIALIDTEAGRALHYADGVVFDHFDFQPPFSPEAYSAAIQAAEDQHYPVIIVDSMSHEWAGTGGCQDRHDEIHKELGGTDNVNVLAWREPKLAHKRMISRLLQCRAHLICCLRAEEKIKFAKDARGKTQIVAAGWLPICEKNFMYEMTVSFMLHDDAPGVGIPIKLQDQHKACFPSGAFLSESAGRELAAWAKGATVQIADDEPFHGPGGTTEADPEGLIRGALLEEIKQIANGRGTTPARRRELWLRHCGTGSPDHVDVAALVSLRDELLLEN